jgi:C-terminal processing protease CtpA/Prc
MDELEASSFTLHLTRSEGLGEGVAGYGIRFVPKEQGPTVSSLIPNGEASRSGVIAQGDVLVAINGISIAGMSFAEVYSTF